MDVFQSRTGRALLLTALLLVQGALILHFGGEKAGFHEDEIATYELANMPGGFLHLTDGFLESWQPGAFFRTVLAANEQTAFDYAIPYHNQEIDVHPPLYYDVIHTVSSLMPGVFSKWTGILPNLMFALLSTLLLFAVARRLFESPLPALLTAAVWALSAGAVSMAVFIRMYAMLTLLCLLLLWIHLRIIESSGPLRWPWLLALLLCTTLGILTQYYYMIYCFFLCGSFFFYLALSKRWRDLCKYVAAEAGAIALSAACFPRMIYHIFSGYRGKQAFRNMAGTESGHLREVLTLMSRELCGGWGKRLLLILGVLLLLCALRGAARGGGKKFPSGTAVQCWLLTACALTAAGYTLLVVRVAPYQVDRYYFCVYPLIVVWMVWPAHVLASRFLKDPRLSSGLLALFFLVLTAAGFRTGSVNYLFPEYAAREEALSAYEDVPAVVLNGDYSWAPDRWIPEYGRLRAVYRCEKNDFSGLARAVESLDLSEGFLIYAVGESFSEEDLLAEVRNCVGDRSCRLITSTDCRVYWCGPEDT